MNPDFYQKNRRALLDKIGGGALVVITGYGEVQRTHDAASWFEQEANFWYLTGVELPDWWLVLDGTHGTEWLVSPEISDTQAVFDGSFSPETIKSGSGIKTIIERDEAVRRLRQLIKHHSIVYTTEQPSYLREHGHFQLNSAQAELKKTLERTFQTVQLCNRELAELRTIKQPEETTAIQAAIDVTIGAIEAMKQNLSGAKYEYELDAILTQAIRSKGARHAYDPIVASGINACTLHYVKNQGRLSKKELVLLDVGARVNGYAADISRTYSLGTPTKRQHAVHDAVREAQERCINLLKPGLSLQEYQAECEHIMKTALTSLKLSTERYREYFPHAMGHGLGVDVHDNLVGHSSLRPGMVLTVEPGIYIRDEQIGVRIEDDILITENGFKNLSARLSTEIR
ncbi:TPA: hypothetical protein DCF80_01280 [Candidatus Saccharibacteria bacterium]|nr:hypothetical protein [Candidatus Saccharibacteria bacterium]HRK40662.1 Xaa-Pro aminopeptidase [Candidatus Saccharibacteria bacterium]